jgi:hypothetical protein
MTLQELLTQYGAVAFEKQQFLGILLGKNAPGWYYDMDKGTVTFGKLVTFKMQIIGSEARPRILIFRRFVTDNAEFVFMVTSPCRA